MALPTSIETKRTLYLQKILESVSPGEFVDWPMPTRGDFALIGKIIVHYSYIDFYLLRINEIYDKWDLLPEKWRDKTEKMRIGDVEDAIEAGPEWSENNLLAFRRIREFRKIRNLMAHFAIKRFPMEDAFLFLAKNERDFKRAVGSTPEAGMAVTGVADIGQTTKTYKVIEGLLQWLSQATRQLEDRYFDSLKRR